MGNRDAGLSDVWIAQQRQRERELGRNPDLFTQRLHFERWKASQYAAYSPRAFIHFDDNRKEIVVEVFKNLPATFRDVPTERNKSLLFQNTYRFDHPVSEILTDIRNREPNTTDEMVQIFNLSTLRVLSSLNSIRRVCYDQVVQTKAKDMAPLVPPKKLQVVYTVFRDSKASLQAK